MKYCWALIVLFLGTVQSQFPCRGCPSDAMPVDEKIGDLFAQHGAAFKTQVAAVAGAQGENVAIMEFEPMGYRVQRVAGTNLYVRIRIGDDFFLDTWIFQPLPFTQKPPLVERVIFGVQESDEINAWQGDDVSPISDNNTTPVIATDAPCGGCITDERDADDLLISMMSSASSELWAEAVSIASQRYGRNGDFQEFKPVRYATQWVAGRYFFVKVQVGAAEFMDVEIFEPLAYTGQLPEVQDVAVSVARDASIQHFGRGMAIISV